MRPCNWTPPSRRIHKWRRKHWNWLPLALGLQTAAASAAAATVALGTTTAAEEHALCWRVLGGSGGSMSTGRHGMGAAMIGEDDMLVFAGGLAHWEGQLDGTADIITGLGLRPESQRTSQTLTVPRTDIASSATARAAYFSGGCGIELAREGPDGTGVNSVEDCRPSSVIDIFSPMEGPPPQRKKRHGRGLGAAKSNAAAAPAATAAAGNSRTKTAMTEVVAAPSPGPTNAAALAATPPRHATEAMRTGGFRLCEDKYAATSGVFYTGGPDGGDRWAGTPHVMVAGGMVPAEPGLYRATDTVDIIREDSANGATGAVKVTLLPVQRLPLPRFDMVSCCFKHACLFAGGLVNLDGYYSDRVDVWDGRRWAFAAEHALSEARSAMGSAVLEVSLTEGPRPVGFFAGGVGKGGGSFLVDLYDFASERWLPRISMPTVRGATRAVQLGRDVAAFVGDGGQVDLFNGTSLCWTSYEISGMAQGGAAVARLVAYFFNESSGYRREEDGTAYFAGGVYNPGGSLSSSVYEMRLRLPKKPASSGSGGGSGAPGVSATGISGDNSICPLGLQLKPVRRTCGSAAASDAIDGFVEEGQPAAPQEQVPVGGAGSPLPGTPPGVAAGGAAAAGGGAADGGQPPAGGQGGEGQDDGPGREDDAGSEAGRVMTYVVIAVAALFCSYMISATVIIRQVEGMWRLPVGGGTCDILCRGVGSFHNWLCSCCGGARRAAARASKGDRNAYHPIGLNGNGPGPHGGSGNRNGGDDIGGGGATKDIEAVRKGGGSHGSGNHAFVVTSAVAVQPYSVDDEVGGGDSGRQHTGVHLQHTAANTNGGSAGAGGPSNGGGDRDATILRAPDGRDGRPPVPPRRPQARGTNSSHGAGGGGRGRMGGLAGAGAGPSSRSYGTHSGENDGGAHADGDGSSALGLPRGQQSTLPEVTDV